MVLTALLALTACTREYSYQQSEPKALGPYALRVDVVAPSATAFGVFVHLVRTPEQVKRDEPHPLVAVRCHELVVEVDGRPLRQVKLDCASESDRGKNPHAPVAVAWFSTPAGFPANAVVTVPTVDVRSPTEASARWVSNAYAVPYSRQTSWHVISVR